jgi:hypothetical protein
MGKTYRKADKNASKKNKKHLSRKGNKSYEDVYNYYVPLVEIVEDKRLSIPDRIQGKTVLPKEEKKEYSKMFKISLETVNQIEDLWAFGENPKTGLQYAWQPVSWEALVQIMGIRDNFVNGGVLNDCYTSGYLKHIFLMGYSIKTFNITIDNQEAVLQVLERPDKKLDFNFFCITIQGKKVELTNWTVPESVWGSKLLLTQKQVGKLWICGFSTSPAYTANVMLKKLRIAEGRYIKK